MYIWEEIILPIPDKMVKIWIVEGGIAGGKSTIIAGLKKNLTERGFNVGVAGEDIDDTKLEWWLESPKERAAEFQMYVAGMRMKNLEREVQQNRDIILCDRGPYGDRAFESMHHGEGNIVGIDHDNYMEMYNSYKGQLEQFDHQVIYLDVNATKCLERVHKRNRGSESSGYTIDYLTQLETAHLHIFQEEQVEYRLLPWPDVETEDDMSQAIETSVIPYLLTPDGDLR